MKEGNAGKRLKIFVSAYACEPYKGSEIGVGWHWVLEMSKYYELWVLTRANNKDVIEKYFGGCIPDQIHFVYYDCPDFIKMWKKQMRGVRIYYTLWQFGANQLIRRVMEENEIEVFHLLTYGNAIWPVSPYALNKCFIWGPTGGTDTIEREFSKHYSLRNGMVEFVRRFVVKLLPVSPAFNARCKAASLILCKTSSTFNLIPVSNKKNAIVFTDVAADITLKNEETFLADDGVTRFLIVGKLDAWRGYDLLIEALNKADLDNIQLDIIGDGSERKHILKEIERYGLNSTINMVGAVSAEVYRDYMKRCDVVINTSLKEGAVTVSFDAMAYGKPLLCIDTTGYTRYFDNDCAIILERNVSRNEMIDNLSNSLKMLMNRDLRETLGKNMAMRSDAISWENKGKEIKKVIDSAYAKYEERCH